MTENRSEQSIAASDSHMQSDEPNPEREQKASKKKRKRRGKKLPPPHQRRMVQALGRIEGCIQPVSNGIEIVTQDGAAFRVTAVGKTNLVLRLLGLPDSERCGRYAFWPDYHRGGIILVSFNNSEEWTLQKDSPPVDEMFVCGTIQALEDDHFSVLVDYGYNRNNERYERRLQIESAPSPEWTIGTWIDLILHRESEVWRWRGGYHSRGPQVSGGFNSWLPYKEAVESTEALPLETEAVDT